MKPFVFGVLADTHGLLRPEAVRALAGCDHILHAGDICSDTILPALARIAPVTAVRGNNDTTGANAQLPLIEIIEATIDAGTHLLYMLHILAELDLDPAAAGFAAVIFGHSHQPLIETRRGVLYLNPGSCGPRRFRLPVTVARLTVDDAGLHAAIIDLPV